MKLISAVIPASLLIAGGAIALRTYQIPIVSNAVNLATTPRHPVTVQMERDAEAVPGHAAPEISLPDTTGKILNLSELLQKGPVVVVMMKDGCPCTIESQDFYNQIASNYLGKATFLGVMDTDRATAAKFKSDFRVPYPVVSELHAVTFRAFRSKRSVYATVINQNGTVEKLYPGYNDKTIIDLNQRVAKLAGVPPKPVSLRDAPASLSSGCAFY